MSIDDFKKFHRKLYEGSVFTGLWIDESVDDLAFELAFDVLRLALDNCEEQDPRTPDVIDALQYLQGRANRPGFCKQFAKAMQIADPVIRYQEMSKALVGIKKQHGC